MNLFYHGLFAPNSHGVILPNSNGGYAAHVKPSPTFVGTFVENFVEFCHSLDQAFRQISRDVFQQPLATTPAAEN